MAATKNELMKRALGLPAEQRAQLAGELVEYFHSETLSTVDKSWAIEAKRRRDEVRTGYSKAIPGDVAQ